MFTSGSRHITSYHRALSLRAKRSGTKLEKTSLRADDLQDLLAGNYMPAFPYLITQGTNKKFIFRPYTSKYTKYAA